MGIHRHPLEDAEGVGQNDIGGFAGDSWQGEQVFHALGDLAVKVSDDFVARALNVFGFVAIEAGGVDQGFEMGAIAPGQGDRIRIGRKQGRGDKINPLIGALGRQNRRHQ